MGRVVRPDAWIGTGVLISDSVLLTNYHVLDETTAKGAVVQFNYQMSATGLAAPIAEFQVDSETLIATSPEDDWTIVHVRGAPGKTWGKLALQPVEIREGDFVNIIQHAAGLPKQIALYHNVVVHADDSRVQYLTDTLPGSSGSPVFNSKWQVVALHHSGGWLTEPGSQHEFWRNEGININAVIRGLIRKNAYPTP